MIKRLNSNYFIENQGEITDILPKGVYNLCYSEKAGFYLERTNDFVLPSKLYGDFGIIDRWIKTYEEFKKSRKSLGILLSGIKGSGKTITAKLLCQKLDQPVIMINNSFSGVPGMDSFLSNPSLGNCTVLIDEYEKIFCRPEDNNQTTILSILDGGVVASHLYILTVNKVSNISDCLMNRPGRIRYRKHYKGLDESIIKDIAEDFGLTEEETDSLNIVVSKLDDVTFDIIMTIISECKRFNELPEESAKHLNLVNEKTKLDLKITAVSDDGTYCKTSRFSIYSTDNSVDEFPFPFYKEEFNFWSNDWYDAGLGEFNDIYFRLKKEKKIRVVIKDKNFIIEEDVNMTNGLIF